MNVTKSSFHDVSSLTNSFLIVAEPLFPLYSTVTFPSSNVQTAPSISTINVASSSDETCTKSKSWATMSDIQALFPTVRGLHFRRNHVLKPNSLKQEQQNFCITWCLNPSAERLIVQWDTKVAGDKHLELQHCSPPPLTLLGLTCNWLVIWDWIQTCNWSEVSGRTVKVRWSL